MADFGLKIGIEGERDFRNSLRDINQAFKVLGSEMKLVQSEFIGQDKSVQSLTARNTVLNKEIDAQKDKVSTLESALKNAADSFGENDKRTQNWQIALNNANAELNGMERELGENEKALDAVGKEEDDAAKSAAKLGDELDEAGKDAEQYGGKFEKLGKVLGGIGKAMGAAFAAVGAAAVGATKALTEMSVGTAAYADEILTMSSVTGMSTESLQAYKYAAELVDVSMETLTKSMAKNIKSMSSATDPTKGLGKAYADLGVTVRDTDGKLRDSEKVYWEAIDALGKMEEGAERDALAMQIFGKSAQDLNPLIAQGSAGIAELTEEAHKMGAVMSDEALEMAGDFDDTIQRLTTGSNAAKNALGMVLMPQLNALGKDGVNLLGDFTRGLNEAGGDWTKISNVIGETVGGIANMILENLPMIIATAMSIVSAIGGAIMNNLPLIIETATTIIMTLVQGLIDALPQITDGALQLILSLVEGIIANLPKLIEAALTMIVTLAEGIGDALPELIPTIIDCVILIAGTLLENMDKVLAAAFKIIEGLARGLINALPKLIEALPKIITGIINFITNNLPLITNMGIKLTVELAAGLIKAIPQLIAAIPQIIASIIGGLGKAIGSVSEIGGNIVRGLWDGIQKMGTWIKDKVSGFFGGIVDGVKGLLGIHSPSTVFAGIGDNMAAGLGQGFEKAMSDVSEDIQNAIPTTASASVTLDPMSPSGGTGVGSGFGSSLITIQQMFVRSEDDIRRVSQELYNLMQTGSRAHGRFNPA
ncbi:hypothetical protein FACS18949_12680 [Clostridia bacterium]|nr:hypothetical protein FACS189425_09490 [Clostridia bacterium]GHV35199.1 hypothetical protein FACS18949_12680 [Clostridia bacterium]